MLAAEEPFEAGGRKLRRRRVHRPERRSRGARAVDHGARPHRRRGGRRAVVKTHELDVPRIGYVHAWQRTQDEGWVRLAFDTFGVPYTYFADQKLREGNLRAKYDVIVYPHVGGSPQSHVNGLPMTGKPMPYKKTAETPNLGVHDESDDIRGGMGLEGLANLVEVRRGGRHAHRRGIDGGAAAGLRHGERRDGRRADDRSSCAARSSSRSFADKKSPIAYGYEGDVLPVYFNQAPVLRVGRRAGGVRRRWRRRGGGIDDSGRRHEHHSQRRAPRRWRRSIRRRRDRRPSGRRRTKRRSSVRWRATRASPSSETRPRVVLRFPNNPNDMLLSGALVGGQALSGRAVVVDAPVGKGHVVMFATRPYWRWQTQGLYFLGFNAILNWNDLDAGKTPAAEKTTEQP